MIPDVEGLVAADIPILMFFGEHRWRFAAPPATVAINTPLSQSHANRRCSKLTNAGLLELVDDRGYYRITEMGIRYYNGEATASDVEAAAASIKNADEES